MIKLRLLWVVIDFTSDLVLDLSCGWCHEDQHVRKKLRRKLYWLLMYFRIMISIYHFHQTTTSLFFLWAKTHVLVIESNVKINISPAAWTQFVLDIVFDCSRWYTSNNYRDYHMIWSYFIWYADRKFFIFRYEKLQQEFYEISKYL